MLIQQLARDEWEEVKPFFLGVLALLLSSKLVVEHFLVVKEQELVFENLRAAKFGFVLELVTILDFVHEVFVLIQLHTSLLLLLDYVLTHLFQMVLK